MTCFLVASISIIGLPPGAGMVSKWYLLRGAAQAESPLAAAAIVIGTLLAIGYLAPIVSAAFFRAEPHSPVERAELTIKEAPPLMLIAISVTAIATIVLFLFPGTLIDLAESAVGMTGAAP